MSRNAPVSQKGHDLYSTHNGKWWRCDRCGGKWDQQGNASRSICFPPEGVFKGTAAMGDTDLSKEQIAAVRRLIAGQPDAETLADALGVAS